ncbi:carcinoembryonic antigen-related cell adhesion molecule 5-like [Sphaeramia orbicularis]|uniref:carcinoembryonic antigen-related cell adhesion molecule 5-like n=1 Tax=Sphaeramia orbicularis TaxID=375764 RepID=UPI00117E5E7B|nr:carcinoembryonic antigen-related cell adhesion molecule 5-like [Sphaeramia orbicularis]
MERNSPAIALLLLLQGVLASGAVEVHPSSNPAVVGENVTLSLSPPTSLSSGSWSVGNAQILTWVGNQQAIFSSHTGRASIDIATRALTLSFVTVADSGVYTVQSASPELKLSTTITVLEPISNVTLRTNQTRLVEFKGSIVASCSVLSGSSLSFLWLNGDSEITANERVHLTDGNSTLTIVNMSRYDQGQLRCCAFNAISNATSDPVNFTVSYGPENMNLTGGGSFATGSNVSMLCLADSSPPARLKWAFRGELLNTTGAELNLYNISEDQSGVYTCQAFNNETSRSENITTQVIISKPSSSASEQAACMWLLPLLSLAGLLFTTPH